MIGSRDVPYALLLRHCSVGQYPIQLMSVDEEFAQSFELLDLLIIADGSSDAFR